MVLRLDYDVIEDYLVTIYRLQEAYGTAKTTLIAKELNVAPATVTKVVDSLAKKGLVRKERYKGAALTEAGMIRAKHIVWKHRVLEVFLSRFLSFDEFESHVLAHAIEHIPDVVVERIYHRMNKPKVCPHGNPIEGDVEGLQRLVELEPGSKCVVKRISGELSWILDFLKKHEIRIGLEIKVVKRTEEKVEVLKDGEMLSIPAEIAYVIFCGGGDK